MLEIIRKNAASWLMKLILGAIVVVFIFWGVGTFRSQRLDVMAKVNGEKILVEDFQKAYTITMERVRRMYAGLPESMFKRLNIKEQVLNQLIDQTLIKQEARRLGLRVTDRELQEVILNMKAFKNNGVFDRRLYELALRNANMTPADFEAQLRQEMLTRKFQIILASGLYCPDSEALGHFKYQNAKLDVEFVKINSSQCASDVNATDTRLKKWFDAHKDKFKTAPEVNIKYLLFSKKDFEKKATVTDKEVQEYYQEHIDRFKVPEERKASHILLKVPQDANATVVQSVKEQILKLKKKIEQGEPFSKVAKEYSQDEATKEKGGELGYFKRGVMVKPFDKVVFSMKKGEISGPVRTKFGWHLIKLEDIKPAKTKSLKEVRDEIVKELKEKKVNKLMWDAANKAYDMIIEMGSLEAYAKAENKELKETGFFSKKKPAPVIGFNPKILGMIFSLDKGELSSLLEVPQGVMIAEMLEKRPPHIPPFEKVKEQVKKAYVKEKSRELCKKKAEKLLELAKKEGLDKAAKQFGLEVHDTGFFKRTDRMASGKLPFLVVQGALSLAKDKPYPDRVFDDGQHFFVIHLKALKDDTDMSKFKEERPKIKQRIREEKLQTAFTEWLKRARERAKIEIIRKP